MSPIESGSINSEPGVVSRYESSLESSLSGEMLMEYELFEPSPDGRTCISFKLLQKRLDGTPYVCNHERVQFATQSAAAEAFSRIEADTQSGWEAMGATSVESLERNPPLSKHQVM